MRKRYLLRLIALMVFASGAAQAQQKITAQLDTNLSATQALEAEITTFAQRALRERYPHAQVSVKTAPLSPVLKHKPCLNFELRAPDHLNPGALSIRVECADWSFYARTQASVSVQAITSKQLIERGKRITGADLIQDWVPLKHVSQAYLSNASDVIGKVAHRTIPMGRPLRARDLHTPFAVNRGDRVVIHAKLGAAHITTMGIAMQNGHIGEQIPVQNERSERVLRPWITAKGTVSTRPNAT